MKLIYKNERTGLIEKRTWDLGSKYLSSHIIIEFDGEEYLIDKEVIDFLNGNIVKREMFKRKTGYIQMMFDGSEKDFIRKYPLNLKEVQALKKCWYKPIAKDLTRNSRPDIQYIESFSHFPDPLSFFYDELKEDIFQEINNFLINYTENNSGNTFTIKCNMLFALDVKNLWVKEFGIDKFHIKSLQFGNNIFILELDDKLVNKYSYGRIEFNETSVEIQSNKKL